MYNKILKLKLKTFIESHNKPTVAIAALKTLHGGSFVLL